MLTRAKVALQPRQARLELRDMLQDWKEGARRGDDPVTASDVMQAIDELIEARVLEAFIERGLNRVGG